METIKLSVHEREETGNGPARRLRAQGLIPGVTYAKGKVATAISVDLEELRAAMAHGHNVVLQLDFGKGAKTAKGAAADKAEGAAKSRSKTARYAVVKQLQFDPISRHLLHVDLHEVDLAVEIEALVTVEAVGTPAGVADGGVVEWERREITVRALPANIPAVLELDVSGLLIGHHLSVAALVAPEGVSIVEDSETLLVALVPPRVEAAPAAEAAVEVTEPEVVGSQKTEE